jgi:GR25 family glycosyltransferase involved in LPS biosynthesis
MLFDYVDRLAIIHLPERDDRLRALTRELSGIGIDIRSVKVDVPRPPRPETPGGFTSRGVHGNFLSHLEIIENAYRDGLDTVWVLEDDAIFSRTFQSRQTGIATCLRENDWDLCFIGHSVWKELPDSPTGLLRFSGPFVWAHSYLVHRRIMPRLIEYLRHSMEREPGDPQGGKIYIDAAFFFFRQFNPDVICIVSSPCLSIQKGSSSSLSPGRYDRHSGARVLLNLIRSLRDELWRRGRTQVNGPQNLLDKNFKLTSPPAQVWP